MSVIQKLKDIIVAKFTAAEQKELADFGKVEVKMKDVKTKDLSKTISYDGEVLVAEMPVLDMTSGTPMPLADGDYTLEDDMQIKVVGGRVKEVKPATSPAVIDAPVTQAVMTAQLKTQKDSFEAIVTKLRAELKESKDQVILLNKAVSAILETPIANPKQKEAKKWEDMTPLEQRRASKES